MERKTHTIDAADQVLGRLASRISVLLQGKHKPDFEPQKDMGDYVVVKNVDKIRIAGRKRETKRYYRHSGYPGGFREISFEKIFEKKPDKVLILAVSGMLPKNRLRKRQLKRLKFE